MTEKIIIAGSGGQGVMTIGKLLVTAMMRAGREVTYLPSYGAEVRGGTANCSVVLSDEAIYSPLIETADTLVIFNQPSYDKFRARLAPGGLIIVNSSMTQPDAAQKSVGKATLVALPATEAADALGNVRVANLVMLGAYAAARGGLTVDTVVDCLKEEFSGPRAHLLELNRKAFLKGQELAGK